ncbi:MAG: sulfatase [Opitutaceae bacterium]|nr:sulfatase [Opitutaceae bacterium]
MITRFPRNLLPALLASLAIPLSFLGATDQRPNILWFVVEDMSAHLGVYGEKTVTTPHVDRLSAEGVRFDNAIVTAPVCSTNRSAMITGMYQTSIGAHQHRSSRGTEKIHLPAQVKLIPKYFQEAGYHTSNGRSDFLVKEAKGTQRMGKTDYNFEYDPGVYNSARWDDRKPGQPFFAQVQLRGGKFRKVTRSPEAKNIELVNPDEVSLPPYYPDHPVIRNDWADYLNSVNYVDYELGQILAKLEADGDLENTIIFFLTDHGVSHARGKQFCYEEGARVPLIVWSPQRLKPAVRKDLVAHIDIAATSMRFAGITIPDYLESRPMFGKDSKSREYVVTARDRCDETVERIRSVRTDRFKYIRNYLNERPHLQPCAYKDKKPIIVALREWHSEGKLSSLQEELLFAPIRPKEELYDLKTDPWELNNLADHPRYQKHLKTLRGHLEEWIEESGDRGQRPESPAMYDSDMEVYLKGMKKDPAHAQVIRDNIAQMKRWAAQGK